MRTGRISLACIFFVLFGLSMLPQLTAAATLVECQKINPRFVVATTEDSAVKSGNVKAGDCYDPIDRSVGATFENAKQELEKMWCGGKANRCGPYVSSMANIDPKFAVCAAKFIAEVRKRDPEICIASAYRSSEHQKALCSGQVCGKVRGPCARGTSKHSLGRAIDIEKPGYNTLPAWVHQMAKQGGNISFPVKDDDGHMEPANTDAGDCASPGYIAPGNGGGLVASPSQNFANTIRQVLGMQPAQPASPAQQAVPSQQLAQSQSPLSSFNSMPTPLVSDSLVTTGTLATTSSVADRLEEIVRGTPTTTTKNATSVPIVINANDVGGVASIGGNNQQSGTAWIGGGITQSTFGSNQQSFQNAPTTNLTRYQSVLASLRSALELMLAYLRPFNRTSNEVYVRE